MTPQQLICLACCCCNANWVFLEPRDCQLQVSKILSFVLLRKKKKIKEKADESFLQVYNSRLPVPFSVLGFCSHYKAHFLF